MVYRIRHKSIVYILYTAYYIPIIYEAKNWSNDWAASIKAAHACTIHDRINNISTI